MLVRRQGSHRQSMDPIFQLVAENIVNGALARNPRQALKSGSNNQQAKMRLAARARPGMTGMEVRFVLHFEYFRGKRRPETFLNLFGDFHRI
ncbi:MAG: hypothetical protein A3E78_11655 [Alphaproteobacteria bacterium RIFCSPHIGHO2_12_FULL_63_12]|nr:MAG: hypothetical protein A3E78_11655 [Alphaproteobacteria bacterium RIFCSPHIGHO2_12_FULL_63_12]